ncbi:DUF4328 domain-containing protein [Streptomyces sp. NPDC050738]|uniref:DUF4328 domain-containing protein n=1 Tax=Streptomyces sp. NPDC050738 TaxID=3154744 RepID=UPI003425A85D
MMCTRCGVWAAAGGKDVCELCAAQADGPVVRIAPPATATPATELRSPVGLSYAVLALLAVWTVGDLSALAADRWGSVGLYDGVVRLQGPVFFACAITFMVWFNRVRVNAEVFSPRGHSKTRTWAYWGWIVPVVNLWYPRRIAIDTWVASSGPQSASYRLINVWWVCWLLSNLGLYSDIGGEAVATTAVEGLIDVAAAVTAALFVRQLTRKQDELARTGPVAAAA